MKELAQQSCRLYEAGMQALGPDEARPYLARIDGWMLIDGLFITRTFWRDDFRQSMDLANAVADMADQEDHHPELVVSARSCMVRFHTHAVGGLTENDFICAAKVNLLAGDPD